MKKALLSIIFYLVCLLVFCVSSECIADFVWTEQQISGPRAWKSIVSSADGTKLVASATNSFIYTSSDSGENWASRVSSEANSFDCITSSTDGTRLAACDNHYIYTSTDSGESWIRRADAGDRDWSSIASSSDGIWLAACVDGGYIYTSNDGGESWIERTDAGERYWNSITSSADGINLAACDNNYIYTSTNSGESWTEQTDAGDELWTAITSSADGTKLAVCGSGTSIFTSNDGGVTWIERGGAGFIFWQSIASSADGTKLVVCGHSALGSPIYTSSDSGATWTLSGFSSSIKFNFVSSSADGSKLAICASFGYIYTSSDSGENWTKRKESGPRLWKSIVSSADGTRFALCGFDTYVYTTEDSGDTWVERIDSGHSLWTSISSSADGIVIVAGEQLWGDRYGDIYSSINSGLTWANETPDIDCDWKSIALSDDGSQIAACVEDDYIYTSTISSEVWIPRRSAGERNWSYIASSADATMLAACVAGGYIYTSNDSGESWIERTDAGNRDWSSIASSSDGTRLAVCVAGGYIYTSNDSGESWIERTDAGNRDWSSIASSSDGTRLAVCVNGGYIYTSEDSGISWIRETEGGNKNWISITSSSDGTALAACVYRGHSYIGKYEETEGEEDDDDEEEDDTEDEKEKDERDEDRRDREERGPRVKANAHTTWYLAEGCTAGFDQWVCIMNPNAEDAFVTVTFMKPDGSTVSQDITVKGTSRYTIHANSVVPNESISTKIESTNDVGVIAERAMYWDVGEDTWAGGHNCCGVKGAAPVWYLAEGCTAGFDEWIPIMNPSEEDAEVTVTFMKPDGNTIAKDIVVKATSRYTVGVNSIVPNESVSTKVESTNGVGIIAERAMYWNSGDKIWVDGHCSAGVTTSDTIWYLAEGCTAGFDEWVLIMNPNDTDAQVKVTFMKPDGSIIEKDVTVKATSRTSLNVNSLAPNESVSAKIESQNAVGIIAERAMYWNAGGIGWAGGHNSSGVTASAATWYLAEGCTAGFDEWVLIMNPNNADADITVTFMKPDGSTVAKDMTIKATSRSSICANVYVPNESISTKIESKNGVGVIGERAMYWSAGGIPWSGGHNASGTIGCSKLRISNRYGNVTDGDTTISVTGTTQRIYDFPIWVGDDYQRSGEIGHGFIGFDISDIKSIYSAKLRLYQQGVIGQPFENLGGAVLVDHVDFGSSVDTSDYNGTSINKAGIISRSIRQGWREIDVTRQVKKDLAAGRSRSQFKLYFSRGTDEDGDADAVIFEDSANSRGTGNKPELVIEY